MAAAFFTALLGSAVIAVLYGLLFAQREDKVRHYFRSKRRGWIRRRYVNAFVGAVRGRAAAAETSLLALIWLVIVFGVFLTIWISSGNVESRFESAVIDNERLQTRIDRLQGETEEARQSVNEALEELKDVEREVSERRSELSGLESSVRLMRFAGWFFAVAGMVGVWGGLLFWHPFIVMRRRFAYELDRFTLRIQGLASKSELAELAVAEMDVSNETTLRRFVEVTKTIADRHSVPQLVKTFDLWDDEG